MNIRIAWDPLVQRLSTGLRLLGSMGWRSVAVLVLITVFQALLPVAMVYAFAGVVSTASDQSSSRDVVVSLLWLGGALLAQRLVELISGPVQLWANRRVDVDFRRQVAADFHRPIGIAHGETEDIRGRVTTVAHGVQGHTPGGAVIAWFGLTAKIVAGIWCLTIIGQHVPWLAGLALVLLVLRRHLQQRSFHRVYRSWRHTGGPAQRFEYWRRFHLNPAAGKEIRTLELAPWSLGQLRDAAVAKFEPVWRGRAEASRASWFPFAIAIFAGFVILAMPALLTDLNPDQLAQVIAAGLTLLRLSEPAGENLAIEHARPIFDAADEVRAAARRQQEREQTGHQPITTSGPPRLQFEQVAFRYPHDDREVLHGVDIDVAAGSLTAIVGVNGAGKTTLTKLLARLYEPTVGRIKVNGVDLTDLDVTRWRRQLAVMLQGFIRYDLTLRANLQLGAPERFGDERFFEAVAPRLGIDDLVAKLPAGWDTKLGTSTDRGVDLSGGQWQRVALARAAFAVQAGRTVVVLDEPTAHLDAVAEQHALAQLQAIIGEATVLLVSHRLSTVRAADQIVVLGDGRVIEQGNHQKLMAYGGQYAQMFLAQAERYREALIDELVGVPT